jgi:hypothetical protein
MELLLCNYSSFDSVKFIQDLGPVIISAIALIVSYFLTKKTLVAQEKQTKMTFDAQKDSEARQEIYKKLNDFYGPLLQIRQESNQLYQKFSEKYRNADPEFATLTYVLDGHKFEGNDKILLDEIIKLGEKCEAIIHSKSGLIDDNDLLTKLIPRATNHFLILRLAEKGVLKGESEKYKDLTFPRELDEKLEERKKQLEEDLKKLNQRLTDYKS